MTRGTWILFQDSFQVSSKRSQRSAILSLVSFAKSDSSSRVLGFSYVSYGVIMSGDDNVGFEFSSLNVDGELGLLNL